MSKNWKITDNEEQKAIIKKPIEVPAIVDTIGRIVTTVEINKPSRLSQIDF